MEAIIDTITIHPRSVLNLTKVKIEEGAEANITLFNPIAEWKLERKHIQSKSINTPFIGTQFTGKVIGIINNKLHHINKY